MAQRTSSAGTTRSRSAPARPGSRTSAASKKPTKKSATKAVATKAKKPATKSVAKKAAIKKTPVKTSAKNASTKKATAKKAPAKKAPAKKAAAKKTPTKKTAAKKTPTKKTAAKKAPAKKAAPKKVSAKKTPAKKAAAKKTPAKQTPSKAVSKEAVKKPSAEGSAPVSEPSATATVKRPSTPLKTAATSAPRPTRRGRKPLTPAERDEMKGVLKAERARLEHEIASAVEDLNELLRDSGDGSGDDQADAGSKTFEREHEMSVANNSRDLLVQVEHALQRIKDGTYGTCESCGLPIGKMRLEAFPRATLCVDCKQRQERR